MTPKIAFSVNEEPMVRLTLDPEGDGCVLLRANGVEIVRVTNHGQIGIIENASESIKKLKAMGFSIDRNGRVEGFYSDP